MNINLKLGGLNRRAYSIKRVEFTQINIPFLEVLGLNMLNICHGQLLDIKRYGVSTYVVHFKLHNC